MERAVSPTATDDPRELLEVPDCVVPPVGDGVLQRVPEEGLAVGPVLAKPPPEVPRTVPIDAVAVAGELGEPDSPSSVIVPVPSV